MENNNINEQIDNTFEQMKVEIAQEVGTILTSKGVDVIPNDYNAGSEVVKLINKYNDTMADIDKQITYNTQTYREDKSRVMNYELKLDRDDLKRDTLAQLDDILVKQKKLHEVEIANKQASPTYKEAKGEMLNVISLLARCDTLPVEQLMDIISPAIETEDLRTLGIIHTLMQNNKVGQYAIESAIKGIEDMAANTELHDMVETMRDYINTGRDGLRYFSYVHKYL